MLTVHFLGSFDWYSVMDVCGWACVCVHVCRLCCADNVWVCMALMWLCACPFRLVFFFFFCVYWEHCIWSMHRCVRVWLIAIDSEFDMNGTVFMLCACVGLRSSNTKRVHNIYWPLFCTNRKHWSVAHSSCAILRLRWWFHFGILCASAHLFNISISLPPLLLSRSRSPYIYPFSFTCSLSHKTCNVCIYTYAHAISVLLLQLHCLRNSNALGKIIKLIVPPLT